MQQVILGSEMSVDLGYCASPFEHVKILVLGFGELALIVRFPLSKPKEKQEAFVAAPWIEKGGYQRIKNPTLEKARTARKAAAAQKEKTKRDRETKERVLVELKVTQDIVAATTERVMETIKAAVAGENDNAPDQNGQLPLVVEEEQGQSQMAASSAGGSVSTALEQYAATIATPEDQKPQKPVAAKRRKRIVIGAKKRKPKC